MQIDANAHLAGIEFKVLRFDCKELRQGYNPKTSQLRKDQQLQLRKDSAKEFCSPLDSLNESPKRLYAQNFCLLFLMAGNNR